MSPASGDSNYSSSRLALLNDRVSIQLMSPASGDPSKTYSFYFYRRRVSIQLMSPASGDLKNIPFIEMRVINVSIQLMSPASGDPSVPQFKNALKGKPVFPFN